MSASSSRIARRKSGMNRGSCCSSQSIVTTQSYRCAAAKANASRSDCPYPWLTGCLMQCTGWRAMRRGVSSVLPSSISRRSRPYGRTAASTLSTWAASLWTGMAMRVRGVERMAWSSQRPGLGFVEAIGGRFSGARPSPEGLGRIRGSIRAGAGRTHAPDRWCAQPQVQRRAAHTARRHGWPVRSSWWIRIGL